ncbi:putative Smr domain protein [Legionella rubrilucens]|uniref:Putative Smr domain protein n=1 Tax=Legionella rubrilucens TaxID=458 RepID=A0A0W0XVQ0_9GAMM|nr:IPT/TIG domain-containing protein [Legionella rubrilucens]KTD48617.1 putative Smr domain protein [Legionella rubrilucens]
MSTKPKIPNAFTGRMAAGITVSPDLGTLAGGTEVTITGPNLSAAIGVTFGGKAAMRFKLVNPTTVTALTPSGRGIVDVVVVTRHGNIVHHDAFTYSELPEVKRSGSYLADETGSMERKRRLMEQEGHRQLARVHAREHPDEQPSNAPEGELQNSIQQHPWLDAQRFDGIDPNLNPEPPLNTEARREFDNERREQEMEKQLRLGNMPKFTTAPKPQGP